MALCLNQELLCQLVTCIHEVEVKNGAIVQFRLTLDVTAQGFAQVLGYREAKTGLVSDLEVILQWNLLIVLKKIKDVALSERVYTDATV